MPLKDLIYKGDFFIVDGYGSSPFPSGIKPIDKPVNCNSGGCCNKNNNSIIIDEITPKSFKENIKKFFNFYKTSCDLSLLSLIDYLEENINKYYNTWKSKHIFLKQLGYYNGLIDEFYNDETKKAIIELQKEFNIPQTGLWQDGIENFYKIFLKLQEKK